MKKKLLAFFMIGLLAFQCIACSGSEESNADTEQESNVDEEEEISDEEEEEELSSGKEEKNDFNEATNNKVTFRGYNFSVPSNWTAGDSSLSSQIFYAESGDKVAMFQLQAIEAPVADFAELESSKDTLIESFGSSFDTFETLKTETIDVADTQGILYTVSCSFTGFTFEGEIVFWVNDWGNMLIVALLQSDNTEYSYYEDFEKILDSAEVYSAETDETAALIEDIIEEVTGEEVDSSAETGTDSGATVGQANALKEAHDYLDYTAFSYAGLIGQLEYEGYTTEEATYAADNCGADWNEQALKDALSYLDFSAFSYSGLIDQLEYEEYTTEQATYAVDNCGADWNEQAAKCAQQYIEYSSFSRSELLNQLEYEGFTSEQAEYGVAAVGY